MRSRSDTPGAVAALLLCAGLAAGCQTYDFEPVSPLAVTVPTTETTLAVRTSTPNLMLLVDTSGSMLEPMNSSLAACRTASGFLCRGQDCPASCPTRWRALQGAMGSFLDTYGNVARMGLATYPGPQLVLGQQCGGTQSLHLDLPASEEATALRDHARKVKEELLRIPDKDEGGPTGGTPTGTSLQFMGTLPQLQTNERTDFVLLLTDGLPNCNETNSYSGASTACRCTVGNDSSACSGIYERLGCLDQDGSVSAVRALRAKNIQTIVIGFGADTATGDGPAVLNAMAEAGGFARKCEKDADCGTGDTCDTGAGLCRRRYYQASNQAELAAALQNITEHFEGTPCRIEIAPDKMPPSEKLLVVYVNDEHVDPGEDTWHLKEGVGVELLGSLCRRAERSTPTQPVKIHVRAVIPQ
jgi:hypothetical protein